MTFPFSKKEAKQTEPPPEFHPFTVLRDWGNGQAFRLLDATTGVIGFGATGSGKTSGPGKHLGYGYLAAGFGGVILCAKKEEKKQWLEWAKKTGRLKDVIVVHREGFACFNFLQWEADRAGEGGGLTINIVALLDEIAGAIANDPATASGGDSKFFTDALRHMNTNLVDLALFSDLVLSLPLMRDIVLSAPQTLDEAVSGTWAEKSVCAAVLREAGSRMANASAEEKADFEECRAYWMNEFPTISFKTRSIITLMFSMMTRPFTTRPLRRLFCEETTVIPEETFDGRVFIIDLPIQEYRLAGRVAAIVWKYCFQVSVMRRTPPADGTYLRPVFLWADECQNFITDFDAEYQAVARSAGGCTVYLTQNRESLRRVLGNDDTVDSLLGNLQTKIFCQNAGETNEWAAKLLGERWIDVESVSGGRSGGGTQSGVSVSEQRRYYLEPSRFTTLARGGPAYDFTVEAVIYKGGQQFPGETDGEPESIPYLLLPLAQGD